MSEPQRVAEVDLDALRVYALVEGLDLEENVIGFGVYSVVYKVNVGGKEYAAKKLKTKVLVDVIESIERRFHKECCFLSQLKHPNVVSFMGVYYTQNRKNMGLIMERLHSDLNHFVEKNPDAPLCDKLHILYDVSKGLSYLHSLSPPLIHCDITARSILLTEDLTAKIGHFGVSSYVDPTGVRVLTRNPRILCYMPLESLAPQPAYTTKLDTFSFGVLMLHTVIGAWPSVHNIQGTPTHLAHYLQEGKLELMRRDKDVRQKMGETHCLYLLLVSCLNDKLASRPTANELRESLKTLCKKHPRPALVMKQSMKKEILNIRYFKMFFVGPPGVGKTLTRLQLSNEIKNMVSRRDTPLPDSTLLANCKQMLLHVSPCY